MTESNKLIIELSNLNEGSIRTIKRELKILVEDYGYKKMVSGCIQVKDTEKAIIYVQHIENHLKDTGRFVMCKVCGKTIDEIYEEEGK